MNGNKKIMLIIVLPMFARWYITESKSLCGKVSNPITTAVAGVVVASYKQVSPSSPQGTSL